MGRRTKNSLPELRCHKGRARLRFRGREYYCGAFGSPAAYSERDRIIGEILCGRRPVASPHGSPRYRNAEQPSLPALPPPTAASEAAAREPVAIHAAPPAPAASADPNGITIHELALLWIDHIEKNKCARGKDRTSCYYRARQAINALEDFWSLPVSQFGTRSLLAVQSKLERTPVVSRPKDPDKKPKSRPRTRQGINDIVSEIRAFFKFGVLMEVVSPPHADSLRAVPPLVKRQTRAPEGNKKKPVADETVNATLPHLPHVVADLILFARLCGCRPCEARTLRPCDIDRRPLRQYKGCWLWTASDWKLDHVEGIEPRQIWINPEAQAILTPWLREIEKTPQRHVFSPRRRTRPGDGGQSADSSIGHVPRSRRSPKQKTNDFYSKDTLNRTIKRACESNGVPVWTAGQLRHTRLTEVREKWGLDHAQAVAGHSEASQTEHYAQVKREKALEVALGG